MTSHLKTQNTALRTTRLNAAKRALETESQGMSDLMAALDGTLGDALVDAVDMIASAKGRVIVSGMGKSGHIGRKIASTLASTGTPAMFVHPAEASHGDLGMITTQDVVLMISNSGESAELRAILNYTQRFSVPLIAMTAQAESTLGQTADILLLLPKSSEACPNGLAPTTSTLLQLALGDALAISLLEDKGFTAKNFQVFHPGGKLGAQIKHASDVMRQGDALPLMAQDALMSKALVVMTEKACGCLGALASDGTLAGIVTDGDLRRHMSNDLLNQKIVDVMTRAPKTIGPHVLASEALEILNAANITCIFVIDDTAKPAGLVHIHDLLRIGVT
jgi:arabinose-5-phosphate isomerase